jgi:hypothetical protein
VGRLSFGSLLPQYLGAVSVWKLRLKGDEVILDHGNVHWGSRASSMDVCHSSLFGFKSRFSQQNCEVGQDRNISSNEDTDEVSTYRENR